ncbi:SDR family NAD(P)-dependent oxidoreductase [Chitinophaga sp. Cy-1792]|uniref:SDR family NAD(P)-dependent oxidoreductase n=1 Tax=Chitinophaga sp. Cy-1792 TaxID=2608339 RepID=UPI0019632697|nr:3-oxoacyl-ACP reductase family protein [Chitinophaga sp. Cy-1792]
MKTVLVTGGVKGIGRAISLRLAQAGYNLVINYHQDEAAAQDTLAACLQEHPQVLLYRADVSDSAAVQRMFHAIADQFGSIDAVINNAGRNIDKPLLEMSEDDWDSVVDVNMKGVFLVSKAAAALMMSRQTAGHIINISATTAIAGRKNGVNYCASKAGVIVMTKCMAKELGPAIRVNCVIPGITRTAEIEERFNLQECEQQEVARRGIPLHRVGEPYEVANIIHFLLSDEAAYINGQKFIVDGGEYMY